MIKTRVISPSVTDPYLNQAIEELLLDLVSDRDFNLILRFWKVKPSVIIGRNQSIKAEVNINACKKYQIPIIRRITGGGAVYLDLGCLNFSFYLNNKSQFFSKNVKRLNRFFLSIVINALNKNNLESYFKPPNSIFINGKKISGNAQIFRKDSVLHHGTLLVNTDLKILKDVLKPKNNTNAGRYVPSLRADTLNLSDIDNNLTIEKIIHDMIIQTEKKFHQTFYSMSLTEEEINLAKKMMKERYLNHNWQFRIP
ncbi:MAG: lipoate--protein ligase family protein [Promethearchaeati archaeon]